MPNWCYNTVQIQHEDPAMIERVRKGFDAGGLLMELIPTPKQLTETVSGHLGDDYADELNQAKMRLNIKYFGHKDWYDWNVANWGTKWDVGSDGQPALDLDVAVGKGLVLNFESAWSPPIGAYEKLMAMGFSIKAYYYEPGMCFAGIWMDGEDDYYEYSGMSSDEVQATIPDELDETFNISEEIAQYEDEENADE